MIGTNFVRRRMRLLQWYRLTFVVKGDVLEITRDDGSFVMIELTEDDKYDLIAALGGLYPGRIDL